jgi:hypothetical protein
MRLMAGDVSCSPVQPETATTRRQLPMWSPIPTEGCATAGRTGGGWELPPKPCAGSEACEGHERRRECRCECGGEDRPRLLRRWWWRRPDQEVAQQLGSTVVSAGCCNSSPRVG